jgi:hypothetical protein
MNKTEPNPTPKLVYPESYLKKLGIKLKIYFQCFKTSKFGDCLENGNLIN